MLLALEGHLGLAVGTIKVYVLVEQLEATFQLMEIRAALGEHFVGYNTGRWDYINSVADALAWKKDFLNPNIDAITMSYGYMRNYEDRVRRAVNTPDSKGRCALWQGGMEPNIPVGSPEGVANSMRKAVAGAEREQREGASGKWVAHWKMVHIVRPVWETAGQDNQLGRDFPRLTYTQADADGLLELEDAPRTIRGARDLLSVGLQYGNAFGQGFQAAALKPADFFDNDDVLYLMEDAATGEIRLSILWEWVHKGARLTEDDSATGVKAGDVFSMEMFRRLLAEEYDKLLQASAKDVHTVSKSTTLPIAREIVDAYVRDETKVPWYIDLLNINLNNHDLQTARDRIHRYMRRFQRDGKRITENLDTAVVCQSDEVAVFDRQVRDIKQWMESPRFDRMTRLYGPRQVAEQRGAISQDYSIARSAAEGMYARPARIVSRQAVDHDIRTLLARASRGDEAGRYRRHLPGWLGHVGQGIDQRRSGADLASYPLSQVPDEAAPIVRALLTADKNQQFARSRMTDDQRAATPKYDFRPFIIADADTGHGGDAHVRNLIRRFVEVGVPGYHIEDQKPGCKKCGHQGGKVLVPVDEQLKRLNTARFQLDVMNVPGIIVARTDAEAATLLDGKGDERDQPFILGVTNIDVPSWRSAYLAILKRLNELDGMEIYGHRLYQIPDRDYELADAWLERMGVFSTITALREAHREDRVVPIDAILSKVSTKFVELWESQAGLKTFGQAVADAMAFHIDEGQHFDITVDEWLTWSRTVGHREAHDRSRSTGLNVVWDCELAAPRRAITQYRVASITPSQSRWRWLRFAI